MKNTQRFLIAAAALALFASAGQARAGGTDSCCDDGIAASPKVRAMLDERNARCCPAQTQVTAYQATTRQTDVAASPKVQQMRSERTSAPVVQVTTEIAGYRPTGADGITASPRTRAMLDEHRQAVEIAPLK
jgi:hypothetical protein